MNIEPSRQLRKTDLRRQMRRKRAELAPGVRQRWDAAINRNLLECVQERRANTVAAYVAFDGEPDLHPALDRLERQGVRLGLPVIREATGRADLCFRQWSSQSEMQANRYGIPEPVGTLDIRMADLELVLIPLVAWDESGGRLGMGASYYDRAFQPFAELDRPLRLGIAYEIQRVENIPLDPWDIKLHGVLTEKGFRRCPLERSATQAARGDDRRRGEP